MNKVMNAREFRWILKRIGCTQTEFADFIHKSRQFVSALCSSDAAVPLRYVNSLIDLVGVELFTIAQAEWHKSENSRHRRSVEMWLFHPHLEDSLPPEARPSLAARRSRLELVEQYLAGAFGTITEKERQRAEEYRENANKS